jgi:EmrB/QacA subfamily drug resistance transporter
VNKVYEQGLLFIGLALAIAVVDVDMTAMNLALPSITADIGTSLRGGQWIINGYLIAAASCMALGGIIGDCFGQKKIFLTAMLFFTLFSLFIGIAQTEMQLIIGRICQGFSVGFTFPLAISLAKVSFPVNRRGIAISGLIAVAGIAQSLGPTVGGVMVTFLNWRWLFFLNLPLCLISIYVIWRLLPTPALSSSVKKIPLSSSLSLIAGLFLIITVLNNGVSWRADSFSTLYYLVPGIGCLIFFIILELKIKNPLVDVELFKRTDFAIMNIIRAIVSFIYFAYIFLFSLILQNGLDYTAYEAGFILLAMTVAVGILAFPAGWLIDKKGVIFTLQLGLTIFLISGISLVFISLNKDNLIQILTVLFCSGVGFSMLIPATATGAISSVAFGKSGAASGILLTNSFIAAGVGIAVSGSLITLFSVSNVKQLLIKNGFLLTESQLESLSNMLTHEKIGEEILRVISAQSGIAGDTIMQLIHQSMFQAFNEVIAICVFLAFTALVMSRILRKTDRNTASS